MLRYRCAAICMWTAIACVPATSRAQGPRPSYLADPATELPWASAYVSLGAGARQRIGFLPLVDVHDRAPTGTRKYTRDVQLDAPIVFVGTGIVKQGRENAYGDLDVNGRVVMFAYEMPDTSRVALEREVPLRMRVAEAAARGAAGVVAFSARAEAPFPMQDEADPWKLPDIPVIVVGRGMAERILAASGLDAATVFGTWSSGGAVAPEALIARLDLRIDGDFPRIDRPEFTFAYEKTLNPDIMNQVANTNEKAVAFALDLFRTGGVKWHKSFVTYFRGFDSKVFYTHHWGLGLSANAGAFMVFDSSAVNLALAVHENTHTLLGDSWGGTSSFLNEGFARYAEAAATSPDTDHVQTMAFMRESRLLPLGTMTGMDVGSAPGTGIAYPAAGSFVRYLIGTYGLAAARTAWQLEGRPDSLRARNSSWTRAFGRDLRTLELDWHRWLQARYGGSQKGRPSVTYQDAPGNAKPAGAEVGWANPIRSR